MIAPHKIAERRVIESGNGKIQEGKQYAQSGLWPEAIEAWKEAVQVMSKNPSAFYDLGLAYEIQGDLDKAETLFKKAASIKQKKLYLDAISRIRNEREEEGQARGTAQRPMTSHRFRVSSQGRFE